MKSFLIFIFLLFCSPNLFAGAASIKFNQIGVFKHGGIPYAVIQLSGTLPSTPACSGYPAQLSFPIEDDVGRLMYSTALAAVTAKKDVWFAYNDTECGWNGDRPLVYRIDVKS